MWRSSYFGIGGTNPDLTEALEVMSMTVAVEDGEAAS